MIKVYLTPFNDRGEFSGEIEITPDVDSSSMGNIKLELDSSEYDIGQLRYNSMSIKLNNARGKYSEIDNLNSVFRYSRAGSKVRVVWLPAEPAICGLGVCGEALLSEEVTIFEGLINDETSKMGVDDQIIPFQVLSYASQLSKVLVPFDDLEPTDTLKDILIKIFDQAPILKYLAFDPADLNLAVNYVPDTLEDLEGRTGQEAAQDILLAANSVMYLDGTDIIVTGRAPSDDVKYHFFGQASGLGNENIYKLDDYRNGQNRVINLIRWDDPVLTSQNSESIDDWGARPKDLDIKFATGETNRLATATAIIAEFKDPKEEFILSTILNADVLALKFLDRVDIDYPTVVETVGERFPIVGLTPIGDVSAPLPFRLWDFTLTTDKTFKIMGMEINPKTETIDFSLRRV